VHDRSHLSRMCPYGQPTHNRRTRLFLRISENLEENLDDKLLRATLPHETTEKGRITQDNGESRFCTDLAVGEPMVRRRYALSSCWMLF